MIQYFNTRKIIIGQKLNLKKPQNYHNTLVQVRSHFIPVSFWCETPKAESKTWKTADCATLPPANWNQSKILYFKHFKKAYN